MIIVLKNKVHAGVSNNIKTFLIKEKENIVLIREVWGIHTEGRRKFHEASTLEKELQAMTES